MPGTTARVQTKVVVRFASTIARQSSSATSSTGTPPCPATPPALFTRMSIRPMRSTSSATCRASETSTVSRSTPCAVAPCSRSAPRIAAPMPWAVPVTSATRPARSGTAPAVLEHVADLLHARPPDAEHVLVRALVDAAERAVAEQLAHRGGLERAHLRDVGHRLPLVRKLDAGEARPREVLEPRRMARV